MNSESKNKITFIGVVISVCVGILIAFIINFGQTRGDMRNLTAKVNELEKQNTQLHVLILHNVIFSYNSFICQKTQAKKECDEMDEYSKIIGKIVKKINETKTKE